MTGGDDDLALLLARGVLKHRQERAFLDRLLLGFVEDEQPRMIAGRLCAHFEQAEQVCPMQADEITGGNVGAQVDLRNPSSRR
jgi:hypothetical protein